MDKRGGGLSMSEAFEVREYNGTKWLNLKPSTLDKGGSIRIPFKVDKDNIKAGYRFEKYDPSQNKILRSDKYEPGYKKVFYRNIILTDTEEEVVYKFSPQLNDAFLARVAEVLLDGGKVEDTTFVLYVNKYGDQKMHVRYSIFIDNGQSEEKAKNPIKKALKKDIDSNKLISDLLREFGYEVTADAINYVKENVNPVTKSGIIEFLKSLEAEGE